MFTIALVKLQPHKTINKHKTTYETWIFNYSLSLILAHSVWKYFTINVQYWYECLEQSALQMISNRSNFVFLLYCSGWPFRWNGLDLEIQMAFHFKNRIFVCTTHLFSSDTLHSHASIISFAWLLFENSLNFLCSWNLDSQDSIFCDVFSVNIFTFISWVNASKRDREK